MRPKEAFQYLNQRQIPHQLGETLTRLGFGNPADIEAVQSIERYLVALVRMASRSKRSEIYERARTLEGYQAVMADEKVPTQIHDALRRLMEGDLKPRKSKRRWQR